MAVVYFAHSWHTEDSAVVSFFLGLIEREGIVASLDAPSDALNAAKPERHFGSSDGMVAVLTRREDGISPYILFEISLALRARKPLLVFVEDTVKDSLLPTSVLPSRILQRRFSRSRFLRQIREHRHAIHLLKTYLGEDPTPRYQPPLGQRACLLIGAGGLPERSSTAVRSLLEDLDYEPLVLEVPRHGGMLSIDFFETLNRADLAVSFLDSGDETTAFLLGAVHGQFLPSIRLTGDQSFMFDDVIPHEYQPRVIRDLSDEGRVTELLRNEVLIYEQDALEIVEPKDVSAYTDQLMEEGDRPYDGRTRERFREKVMGDKYVISGQAGAVGPQAEAHDIAFTQIWQSSAADIDVNALALELAKLRSAMKVDATAAEQDMAVAEVGQAELAAKKNDGPGVLAHLSKAGNWAFDKAIEIGIPIASDLLRKVLGLA